MGSERQSGMRLRTTASSYQCENCPPDRVCAWGCIQGAGVEEIVIGASLALDGLTDELIPVQGETSTRDALWDSFNSNTYRDR